MRHVHLLAVSLLFTNFFLKKDSNILAAKSGIGKTVSKYCGCNSRWRQENDLINYEQKSTSSNKKHEYQEKTKLVLIIGSRNKTWVQLVLTRVGDNVLRLSIYTLDIYSILHVVQAIFMVVAWALSYLACTPSYHEVVPWGSRHL